MVSGKRKANRIGLQQWKELNGGSPAGEFFPLCWGFVPECSPITSKAQCLKQMFCLNVRMGTACLLKLQPFKFHSRSMKSFPALWAQKLIEDSLEAEKLNSDQDLMQHPTKAGRSSSEVLSIIDDAIPLHISHM